MCRRVFPNVFLKSTKTKTEVVCVASFVIYKFKKKFCYITICSIIIIHLLYLGGLNLQTVIPVSSAAASIASLQPIPKKYLTGIGSLSSCID